VQHLAASEGHKSTVRLLLAASAHVNVTDRFGGTCVARARTHTLFCPLPYVNSTITPLLGTPLMDAIREGHSEISQMLRDAGASDTIVSGAPQQKVSLRKLLICRPGSSDHPVTQGATSVGIAGYGSVDAASSELRKRKL
jgi:ankyrin repeat protein